MMMTSALFGSARLMTIEVAFIISMISLRYLKWVMVSPSWHRPVILYTRLTQQDAAAKPRGM